MFQLVLDGHTGDARRWDLGARPLYIGRAPGNDVILGEDALSGRHAAIWEAGGRVFIEDLRSKNGTFCGEIRIRAVVRAIPGVPIRLGPNVQFSLIEDASVPSAGAMVPVVEDVGFGLTIPFRSDRIRFGSAPGADVALPDAAAEAAVVLVDPDGIVWLGVDDDARPLALGETFHVAGRAFRLAQSRLDVTRTSDLSPTRYPYVLDARLVPAGAEVLVTDPEARRSLRFDHDNRAMLLFLLALKANTDCSAGVPSTEAGWCHDEDLGDAIWGRPGRAALVNNLHVLVCRTRRELKDAGFDPWFIEKRNRHTRARVGRVEVLGDPRVAL